jgi:Bacterial transcriptional activator domain/AAA ATPase domain
VLREALGLWRGPALADVADEPFAQAERHRLEELRLVVLEDRLAAELALGGHATAAAELEELVGRFPFRERLHGLLMLALYRSGRQAEALRAFQAARRTLGEELGIDPGPRLRQLETEILRQSPALDWTPPLPGEAGQAARAEVTGPPVAAPATLPPPPAGEGELVGREEQLVKLNAALTAAAAGRGRVVLTAGEPGIGKTRLAEEMARRAAAQDVGVAWGRCYQGEGAPAFWPWEQITRGLLRVSEAEPGEHDRRRGDNKHADPSHPRTLAQAAEATKLPSSRTAARPRGRLPTRQVAALDRPHPSRELGTIAARPNPIRFHWPLAWAL